METETEMGKEESFGVMGRDKTKGRGLVKVRKNK